MTMRAWIAGAALLAGCAGSAEREAGPRLLDLGIEPPSAKLAGLRVAAVRAAPPNDSADMLYRLAYRDPAEVLAFAQHRWAAAPAVLLQRQLARAAAPGASPCALEFELMELTQVFDSRDASRVVLEGRAMLASAPGVRAAERVVRVVEDGAGGSPATGARAVARAADRLIGELSGWASRLPACRAG